PCVTARPRRTVRAMRRWLLAGASVIAAAASGHLLFQRHQASVRLAKVAADPHPCSRWPGLAELAWSDENARQMLHGQVNAVAAAQLPDATVAQVAAGVQLLEGACPYPFAPAQGRRLLEVLAECAGCASDARTEACSQGLYEQFAADPSLRRALFLHFLAHPTAWERRPFSDWLVRALEGEVPAELAGALGPKQVTPQALAEALGAERLATLAAVRVADDWPTRTLFRWATLPRSAWWEAIDRSVHERTTEPSPIELLPAVRVGEEGEGRLAGVDGKRCRILEGKAPLADGGRVTTHACPQVHPEVPAFIAFPFTSPWIQLARGEPRYEYLLFDVLAQRFHGADTLPLPASARWFAISARGVFSGQSETSWTVTKAKDGEELLVDWTPPLLHMGVYVPALASVVSVLEVESTPLDAKQLSRAAKRLRRKLEATEDGRPLALQRGERLTSPWLSHSVNVYVLAHGGVLVEMTLMDGTPSIVYLDGVDWKEAAPPDQGCFLSLGQAKSSAEVQAILAVPGDDPYFLVVGKYEDSYANCEAGGAERGYFNITCHLRGCALERLKLYETES
ncbi:MAG: hypothetical protein ACOZIN_22385, partial [Myxococcota bacterium]